MTAAMPAARDSTADRPELAGPKAPDKPLSFFAAFRAMKQNPLATIPRIAYQEPIWRAKSLFDDQLVVSDPAGIKHILLDNVANYPKAALDVSVLSAAFGEGLLTSQGDKWRVHRRVMSPSFDHRSIASYAPVITDAAAARLKAWDAKGDNAEINITREMLTLTLEVISRAMFSTDSETGFRMTDEEVRDEVVIIFIAGHETSALASTYVWYLLSLHPEVEAKLHAELDAVLGGRAPAYDDLEKLSYTRMVIDEAMRLYPPAPMLTGRVALETDEICGRPIAKGTQIAILPWVVHRHRTLWDDPDRFDPERFSRQHSAARPRFAYLPFGGGPRICIGAQLALTEVSLLVATMAQRYRLKLVPQDIVLLHRVTLHPRDGIRMQLQRRH
jgi:cytochrome P450